MASESGRWWEFYFVRYLIGTLIGAVIIHLVTQNSELRQVVGLPDDMKEVADVLLLAGYGLALCYIASIPLLVWHGVRPQVGLLPEFRWPVWLILLLLLLTFSCLLFFSTPIVFPIAVISANALIILAMWCLVLRAIWKPDTLAKYYGRLARVREQECRSISGYVESYRHLREHGNALFIVVMEILMGLMLHLASNSIVIENGGYLIALFGVYIVLWIFPGALTWFVAQSLERTMVRRLRV